MKAFVITRRYGAERPAVKGVIFGDYAIANKFVEAKQAEEGTTYVTWDWEEVNLFQPIQDPATTPYLTTIVVTTEEKYNPDYKGEDKCECGHPYYRHFDSYEDMEPVGCKYCLCHHFTPKKEESQ